MHWWQKIVCVTYWWQKSLMLCNNNYRNSITLHNTDSSIVRSWDRLWVVEGLCACLSFCLSICFCFCVSVCLKTRYTNIGNEWMCSWQKNLSLLHIKIETLYDNVMWLWHNFMNTTTQCKHGVSSHHAISTWTNLNNVTSFSIPFLPPFSIYFLLSFLHPTPPNLPTFPAYSPSPRLFISAAFPIPPPSISHSLNSLSLPLPLPLTSHALPHLCPTFPTSSDRSSFPSLTITSYRVVVVDLILPLILLI